MLSNADLIAFVPTVDLDRALTFYQGVLGLRLIEETPQAAVFQARGATLRVSVVAGLVPAPYTTVGWAVEDIAATVRWLAERGVRFTRYDGLDHDDLGVWAAPGGDHVAWFTDPDGHTLSVTQFAD